MRRLILLLALSVAALAQGNGYTYLHTIGVTRSLVQADLTSFPLYVAPASSSWAATVANGGQVVNTTTQTIGNLTVPADLIFTKDRACATKVTGWQWAFYSQTTGLFGVRINLDTINSAASHTADTVIYACVGKASVTTLQTTTTLTWDASFVGAWDLPNGTTLTAQDSTGNNDGTANGTVGATDGKIDGGASFPGNTSSYISTGTNNVAFEYNQPFTLSAWIKLTDHADHFIIAKELNSGTYRGYYYLVNGGGGSGTLGALTGIVQDSGSYMIQVTGSTVVWDGNWHQAVFTYDGSGAALGVSLYVDGLLDAVSATGSDNLGARTVLNASTLNIGSRQSGGVAFKGSIDEPEVSSCARSKPWIAAEYQAIANQANFVYVDGAGLPESAYSLSLNWTPRNIPGLAQWWAADAITGHSDGDVLATVPELTFGLNTPLGACAAGATYRVNIQNGLPALRFGASSCYQSAYGEDVQTLFYAGSNANSGSGRSVAGAAFRGTVMAWRFRENQYCYALAGDVNGNCTMNASDTGSKAINEGRLTTASTHTAEFSRNGALQATATNSNALASPTAPFYLGATPNTDRSPTEFLNEDLWELLAFNRSLSDYERSEVISYLSRKWFRISPMNQYWYSVFDTGAYFALYNASDAATWTVSPQSYQPPQPQIRDPSLARINGQWCIVNTIPYEYSFQVYCSADLGVWKHVATITGGGGAPEWFADSDGSWHVLCDADGGGGAYILWETHPTNAAMTAWSTPVALTTDNSHLIDPFLLKIGATYELFVSNKTSGTALSILTSSSLLGPYTTQKTYTWGNEGPSVVRIDGAWRLSWDPGSGGLQYADCTGDPATCTWGAVHDHSIPMTQHGTLVRVSNPVAAAGVN
jgi:hypothetical protein